MFWLAFKWFDFEFFLFKASRSFSQTSQDSEDDNQPLAFRKKIKTEVKAEKPVKRKAEDLDDEDDFAASKKKNKKVKEEKKEKKEKANKKTAAPNGSPTKRAKKEKEEEETWKWYVLLKATISNKKCQNEYR